MKNFGLILLTLLFWNVLAGYGFTQQAPRTTIQLPVLSFFSGVTTVNVPDHGHVLLGSVKRSAAGSVSRSVPGLGGLPWIGRPFGNRASRQSRSASTMQLNVQIHDMNAMDKALLEEARKARILKLGGPAQLKKQAAKDALLRKADFISRNLGRTLDSNR